MFSHINDDIYKRSLRVVQKFFEDMTARSSYSAPITIDSPDRYQLYRLFYRLIVKHGVKVVNWIGYGNGEEIILMAKHFPTVRFIGYEVLDGCTGSVRLQLQVEEVTKQKIPNLLLLPCDFMHFARAVIGGEDTRNNIYYYIT